MSVTMFDVPGAQIACEVAGHGIPLVLLHGFPFHRGMWRAQIESLAGECRVIAPDLRGFGESTLAADDIEQGVAMSRYADDVAAVLEDLSVDEPIVLVGFSMGGYAAFQFAFKHPRRLRGLVLCDTRAVADTDEARAGRLKMAEAVLAEGDSKAAEAMLPKLLSAANLAGNGPAAAAVRSMLAAASPHAIAAAQRGMARRDDVRSRLGEIRCPVLGVVGAEDAISPPAEMREIVAAVPQGRLVEIPESGHSTPLEQPAAVSEALREFLREA